jgi:hypothetical protein
MRAGPAHDFTDTLMKQKVAESVVQRVVGHEDSSHANGPKVWHPITTFNYFLFYFKTHFCYHNL